MRERKLLVANWKMHLHFKDAFELTQKIVAAVTTTPLQAYPIVLCVPSLYIESVTNLTRYSNLFVGAQNVHHHEEGAFTGEISAGMVSSCGAGYCIIGHSERREYFKETPEMLAAKIHHCLTADLHPIYCVGEKLTHRKANHTFNLLEEQLARVCFMLPEEAFQQIVIAYEPVWAIGTGQSANPDQVQEVHRWIRQQIAKRYSSETAETTTILYGGSIKSGNAEALFRMPDVDGGLVGGSSLIVREFIEIASTLFATVNRRV